MDYSPDQSNPSIEECHKRLQTLIRNEKNGQDWFQLFFCNFLNFSISSPLHSCDYYYTIFCFAFFIFCCFCEVFAVGCALFFSVFEYFFGYIKLKIWIIYSSNKLLVIQFIWLMCYNSCNSLFSQPLRNSDKNQIQIFFRHFFWKILLSLWNMIWRSWSDQFLSIQWHLNDCCCLVNGSSVQCTHSLLVIVFIPERRQNVATFHSALKFFKKLQLFGKSAKKN